MMDKEKRVELYKRMLLIRAFENKILELDMQGKLPGFFHLYVGEEAVAVGVCDALNKDDYITSTHRGHGHILAKGGDVGRAMAELYGRETGYNKARGGSMHISAPEVGMLGANGIVGGGIPIATGAAFSSKYLKDGKVTVCFFGDGASNEGTFHEAINIGASFDLPVIYVCENNLYGVTTDQRKVRKQQDIGKRAIGYDIPGVIVDGNDVEAVRAATIEAASRARAGKGPTLIECKTYRHYTHFVGEPDCYRPKEEVAEWMAPDRDPILRYAALLVREEGLTEDDLKELAGEVDEVINAAVEFAEKSPKARPETALDYVYAD